MILVSIDGFRNDYLDRFAASAPALARLARTGVRADAMRPGFPSITFPTHHTLVTGLYPAQHGVIANTIPGPNGQPPLTMNSETPPWWTWKGEPIWITAAKQGLKSGAMFWPASYAEINGHRPTYRQHPYDPKFPYASRVAQILAWLDLPDDERPSFMTLYFEAVDAAGHADGPSSDAVRDAIARVDREIDRLMRGLDARDITDRVNVIVTADHGMTAVDPGGSRVSLLSTVIDPATIDTEGGGPFMYVNAKDGNHDAALGALARLPHARAYRKDQIPEHLHYRDHPKPFALFLLADDGWTLVKERTPEIECTWTARKGQTIGVHGYDVAYPSMKTIFVAHGPGFTPGARLRELDSVHVYALLAHLLGIEPAPQSGRLDPFASVLASKSKPTARARASAGTSRGAF